MFGKIGAGKSSFLNTVVTALMNTDTIYRDYNTAPSAAFKSKTKTVRSYETKTICVYSV